MTLALSDLLRPLTPDEVLTSMLSIADSLGLTTSTWHRLGITRTIFATVARKLADLTSVYSVAAAGGLLDYAEDGWLTLLASNVYGVTRIEDAAGTTTVTLTNTGGDTHVIAAGDLTFEHTSSGKTYRNTTGGTLNASPDTLDLEVIAEESGSDSNALAGEIDTLVTTLLGVTVTNADPLVGTDGEEGSELRERCRDALGALSPNGASSAYEYVARTTLRADDSTVDINRVRVSGDTATGVVTVTLAAPGGVPIGGDVTLVNAAIQATVVPVSVTAYVAAASGTNFAIEYEAWVADDAAESNGEIEGAVEAALAAYFRAAPIGGHRVTPGGTGTIYADEIVARISEASDAIFRVDLTNPASDTNLTATQVPVLGTITPTITRVVQT